MGQVMGSDFGQAARERRHRLASASGSLACYAAPRPPPRQDWHFYEIDAMVDRVARDPALFTFLFQLHAPRPPTHLGDARVVLVPSGTLKIGLHFDILVIDCYSRMRCRSS